MNQDTSEHEKYMERCLGLAGLGLGMTAPNPMVGAVVVYQGKIIGEGYHRCYGMAHAEINAMESVSDKGLLSQSTLYVSLEPCNHFGKTPPCTEAILRARIPRIVIGACDPNRQVTGKGVERLRQAGCQVETGVLEKACRFLNRRFYMFHEQHRPWIILKWAQTQDGFIDRIRQSPDEKPVWITDELCRMLVHKWRTEEQSILVGTRTAMLDNPRLNARLWPGKQPVRLVVDRGLSLPSSLHIMDGQQETYVFSQKKGSPSGPAKIFQVPFKNLPAEIVQVLFENHIQSVIIEGGSRILSSFITANLWDEARIFTGAIHFGKGVPAPAFPAQPSYTVRLGPHNLAVFYRK